MVRWTLYDTLAFLLLLSLLLPSLLIMFIPSTFKRPVSSWKALNLRKTLLMASSVRLKPLNCSRLPCVYAQETLTFLLMPHDLSHLGFLAGQIGRLITISTTPVIAGDSFEMDAVGALRLSPLRRGLAIDSTVDIFTFYVPH